MLSVGLSKRKNNPYDFKNQHARSVREALFEETYNAGALEICRKRVNIAIAFFFAVYAIIAVRVFMVCLPHGIEIKLPEDETKQREILIKAPISRADIVDRNGIVIATSLPTVDLYANPKKIQDAKDAAEKLSEVFSDMKYEDLYAKLTKKTSFVMIKHDLSPAKQSEVNALGIPALEFLTSEKRVYLHDNLFAHVLGYTNVDNVGQAGIEKFMHKRLTESTKPLELTVDLGIQDTIRQELLAAMEKFSAAGAAAILMNVNTGEVISMVSLPDYNPNIKIPLGDKSLFNFPTLGTYEPGSVFKTFNTALGLESGKVKVTDKFDATKPIKIQRRIISDYRGENRWLTVGEILIHSSNIGSVQLVSRVGRKDQRKFLENLGFFAPFTDFEIPEKAKPSFQSQQNWTDITMATVSYGHGISVTPLHVITAFSALMNGGIYHAPTLIKSSVKKPSRRVISERTSEQMRPLLRDVILYGSGKKAEVQGYEVAGKTGTAQKVVNGKYIEKCVTNSFLSVFPASNPLYALLVILDEPKAIKETYGFNTSGWNAAPTAGKIISEIAPQLGLKANFDLQAQRAHIKAVQ